MNKYKYESTPTERNAHANYYLTDLPPLLPNDYDEETRDFIYKHKLTPPAPTTEMARHL